MMMLTDTQSSITQAISLLHQAQHVVALTGAGISTPSGIPDFRTPASGLWEKYDPMEVASLSSFQRRPDRFYDWIHPLAQQTAAAEPNPAHMALANLELWGKLACVITQNIDALHTKAGSRLVYEVHGHLREVTCMGCRKVYAGEPVLQTFIQTAVIPRCESCAAVLKPNVILFGELLPTAVMAAAEHHIAHCDLVLVVGSSLETAPVGDLPWRAKRNGARVIIVNLGETYMDNLADIVIRADVAHALPQIAAAFAPVAERT